MPAHTAGRIGGSVFGSKKAALASAHANDHRGSHPNKIVVNHHSYHTAPMIMSGATTIIPSHFNHFAAVPVLVPDGAFITFFIAFHIVSFVLWSRYNKD